MIFAFVGVFPDVTIVETLFGRVFRCDKKGGGPNGPFVATKGLVCVLSFSLAPMSSALGIVLVRLVLLDNLLLLESCRWCWGHSI